MALDVHRSRENRNPAAWRAPTPPAPGARDATLLGQIGNTPLLDLTPLARRCGVASGVSLLAKAEWFNPGGSVKARAALAMVNAAESDGRLRAGQTLIDSSSGNTAIALALIGAARGHRVLVVMPANVSRERKALVLAYGATLVESDPLEGSDGAILRVREIVAAAPERFCFVDQYNNPANWLAHFRTTGPEIWAQTGGAVTHFVAGLGTTGTFVGVGRALRRRKADVQLVAVQPQDDLAVIEGLKHLQSAILPGIHDPALAATQMAVDAETAWVTCRRLVHECALFVGPSSGAAVAAALRVAAQLDQGVVVTLLPDGGDNYISLGLFD